MDIPEQRPLSEAREPVMLLFIGVIIMLLAFFVVMNHAASTDAKRGEAVMRGVVTSFDGGRRTMARFTSNLGEAPGDAALNGKLGKLVATSFPLGRVSVIQPGRVFLVSLPVGNIWLDEEVMPTDAGNKFIAALAQLLGDPQAGALYELDARLVAENETPVSFALARIAAFGDAMEAAGAPAGIVATGVDLGKAERLRLIFSLRETADGRR